MPLFKCLVIISPEHTRCTKLKGAYCDTDHYLVVAKLSERLAVSKQAAQKYDGERFELGKLNEP